MRRSTAAAVGTLTGAALIVGVRLSVQPPAAPPVAPPVVDLANNDSPSAKPSPKKPGATTSPGKKGAEPSKEPVKNGLRNGIFKGKGSTNPYGTIQVSIKVENGKITKADATYPVTGDSAIINPDAIPKLNQAVLEAQNADVAAVSGASYTSQSYKESLQAALDLAKA